MNRLVLVGVGVFILIGQAAAQPQYRVTEIGPFTPLAISQSGMATGYAEAYGINNMDTVVGQMYDGMDG